MGVTVFTARRALRNPETRRRRDAALLRLPMLGLLLLKTEAARFSRTLGTLIGNGVPLPAALAITADRIGGEGWHRAFPAVSVCL
jgi:general secretion pathway protein F